MSRGAINADELDADTRKRLGLPKPDETTRTLNNKEDTRRWAFRVNAFLAGFTTADRVRILNLAIKQNKS